MKPPTSTDSRLLQLAAAHALVLLTGFAVGPLRFDDSLNVFTEPVYLGLTASQASLIAIWAALGAAGWRWRALGLLVGCVGEGVMMAAGSDRFLFDGIYVMSVATFITLGAGWYVRKRKGPLRNRNTLDLEKAAQAQTTPPASGFQFSIREMMAATASVAVMATVFSSASPMGSSIEDLAGWTVLGCCMGGVGFSAAWAQLDARRPWTRSVIATALSLGLGVGAAWGIQRYSHFMDLRPFVGTTLSQCAIMIASLWLVRRWGYSFPSR